MKKFLDEITTQALMQITMKITMKIPDYNEAITLVPAPAKICSKNLILLKIIYIIHSSGFR